MAGSNQIVNSIAPFAQMINPRLFRPSNESNLFMPFYHGISNADLPHISHLYPVKNAAQFEKDIDFLLKHYEPLDLQTLIKHSENKSSPTKPSFFLSFDDGLREFHTVIAPILKRKGVTATCFLNSGFINNLGLFFRYKISLIINYVLNHTSWNASSLSALSESKQPGIETTIQNLLALTYKDQSTIANIANELGINFDTFLKEQKPYLSSAEIQSLIKDGFTFGAHSIDHPEYRFISEEEQKRQTQVSMEAIANQFNLDYRVFSFPFTDHGVSKELIEWMHQTCGVQLSFGCAGHKWDTADNHYQRVAFENENFSARKIHNAEMTYALIRKSIGKNTVKRK
jgi:peptidoglycan/xylan/chitin deacetylase (PgdA/CDA1 family)